MADYARLLKQTDSWWLMFFYAVSFGGFVGLSSFLPIYFHDQYKLSPVTAGYFTAACVFAGSFARPFGGYLADRVGGTRALSAVYAAVAAALFAVSQSSLPLLATLAVFIACMATLGMGNGAVFQLVPQRFGRDVGLMTGLVGMTGGIGGFYLAASLGYAKQFTGSYSFGFAVFAGMALVAWAGALGGAAALAARGIHPRHRPHLGIATMNMVADPREHLVVIARGMAGMRTVEELLKLESGSRFRITVFGAEPHVNYNRIMLSSVLAGDKAVDDIVINSREWYDENDITLVTGDAVTRIDRGDCTVLASRVTVRYDRLLCTGSKPVAPPDSRAGACPVYAPFATSLMSTRCLATAKSAQARGCDWWRPAGAGSSLGPETARHVGGVGAPDADPHGTPAGRRSRPDVAA